MGLAKAERNLERENENRRKKTARAREDKVIIGYIMKKYPKTYEEGRKYARELAGANPNKIDLTKTSQFRAFVKGPCIIDNMELKIELLDEADTSTTRTPETSQVLHEADTSTTRTPETSQALQMTGTFEDLEVATHLEVATLSGEAPPGEKNLLPLSEEDFNTMMDDLRQDPTIQDFFTNIEFELDECPMW